MAGAVERRRLLGIAKEVDGLDRDLPTREADFLNKILKLLQAETDLTAKEIKELEALHKKYVKGKDAENGGENSDAPPFDRGEKGADDDVDEDDFV